MKLQKLKYKDKIGQLLIFTIKSLIVAAILIGVVIFSTTKYVEIINRDSDNLKWISFDGKAESEAVPNVFEVTIGVDLKGTDPIAIQNESSDKLNKAIEDLKSLGISEENIKTSKFELAQVYGSNEIGFKAYLTVTVKNLVSNDTRPSEVISTAFSNELNIITYINYSFEGIDDLREELKVEALENAKSRKESFADEVGIKFGRILNVKFSSSEGKYVYKDSYYLNNIADSEEIRQINIEAGSQTVSETAIIDYEIL